MKKLFYLSIASIMLIAMFAACSSDDDGGSKNIEVHNKGELNQTVYADKNAGKSTVKFTTTGIWTSSIETTSGETPTWVSISPDSGAKGEYEIALTLDVNTTGKERSAKIIILCDGYKVEIKITQKAKTEAGEVPTVTYKYYIKEIRHVHDGGIETDKIIFTYNSEMQPTKIYLTGDEGYKEEIIILYETDKINYTFKATGERYIFKNIVTLNLNGEGYVSSGRNTWSEEGEGKSSGSGVWNITYDNGYLKKSTGTSKSQDGDNPEEIENHTHDLEWKDGNMVRITEVNGLLSGDWVGTATYNTTKVNPLVNVNLNMLIDNLEVWSFIVNESHDWDTSFMGFGNYGKTNTNYIATQKDEEYSDEASYTYTLDNNDLVTKITYSRGESEAEGCDYEIEYTRVELTE